MATLTETFSDIADAIRGKNGSSNTYTPAQMPAAITAIPTGGGGTYQTKTVSPSESSTDVTPDSGYDALSKVTINAISSSYVGSGIARRSGTNLSASGKTVTVPAGYYENQATKDVSTMTLPTSTSASATSGYTSKATVSRSTSDQYINIAPGYNEAGGYYKVEAVANGSVTAPSSISGTDASIGANVSAQTLTFTKTISVTPNVTTAGYISSGTAGNSSVSLTASAIIQPAQTITPGTTNQTIASGTYLTGTQTISGDSDLTAANIKTGVQIFNVTGSYTSDATAAAGDIVNTKTAYVNGSKITGNLVINKYYTGTSAPSSSLGNNGDIYFQS